MKKRQKYFYLSEDYEKNNYYFIYVEYFLRDNVMRYDKGNGFKILGKIW